VGEEESERLHLVLEADETPTCYLHPKDVGGSGTTYNRLFIQGWF